VKNELGDSWIRWECAAFDKFHDPASCGEAAIAYLATLPSSTWLGSVQS